MRTAAAVMLLGLVLVPAAAEQVNIARPVILSPVDGATVVSPVTVTFKLVPAGMMQGDHMHLIVDAPLPPAGSRFPMDARHIHLMHGEMGVILKLAPGRHTIQLVEGSSGHVVPTAALHSDQVTFEVK